MKVIKRDGTEVPFDEEKIIKAIRSANSDVAENDRLSEDDAGFLVQTIRFQCESLGRAVSIEEIQDMVIEGMADLGHYQLALHYSEYRLRHEQLRKKSGTDAKVLSLLRHENELAKQENANKDPVLNSTMRDYLASEVSEDICRRYIFPEDVIHAHDEGMIHVHDMGYVSGPISNCELVNLEDMLQNGTVITDTMIEKPHSFSTACNIATQIIAQVASNTYGGQTISLDDNRSAFGAYVFVSCLRIGKAFVFGCGNTLALHEGLGKIFGTFELSGFLGRAKNQETRGAENVDHTFGKGGFRTNDREVNLVFQGPVAQGFDVGDGEVFQAAVSGRSGVAGGNPNFFNTFGFGKTPGKRVFTTAAADH